MSSYRRRNRNTLVNTPSFLIPKPKVKNTGYPIIATINPNIVITKTMVGTSSLGSGSSVSIECYYQRFLDIIQELSDHFNLVEIAKSFDDLKQEFTTEVQNIEQIDKIIDYMFSVMCNISNNVPYNIIMTRLRCLKELIANAKDVPIPLNEYECIFSEIIQMITDGYNLDAVITRIQMLRPDFEADYVLSGQLDEIQNIIIGIIENITNNAPYSIVMNRIAYCKQRMTTLWPNSL